VQLLAPGVIARPGADVEAVPSLTMTRSDRRAEHGATLRSGPSSGDVGLDVRWGATSGSALNLTLNPDFSQVEADAPQLEANTRFALSVPERRPFFLEGAELFRTPLRAVFTRTIVDPLVGAKLAGREGAWSGGLLYANDETTQLLIPGTFGSSVASIEAVSHAWAARGTHSRTGQFATGGLLTGRAADGYDNTVAGLDAYVRPISALEVTLQALGSTTRYPAAVAAAHGQSAARFGGTAVDGVARFATRDWRAYGRYQFIDRGFRADLGLMPEVDAQRMEASLTRSIWGDNVPWLTRLEGSIGGWNVQTVEGALKERGVWSELSFRGLRQTFFAANPFWLTERFAGVEYARGGVNYGLSVQLNSDFSAGINARRTGVVDYANERSARLREFDATMEFRAGRRFSTSLSGGRRAIRHQSGLVVGETIMRARPILGFSSRAFLTILMQARRIDRDAEAHPGDVRVRETSVESQAVFTYRVDGQTALRLGYSDLASDRGPGIEPLELEQQFRTWFLKLSYAWRP
jgi:hypothetical protein